MEKCSEQEVIDFLTNEFCRSCAFWNGCCNAEENERCSVRGRLEYLQFCAYVDRIVFEETEI